MPDLHDREASGWSSYYQDLTRFLRKRLRCRELAADLVQETYLRLAGLGPATDITHPRAFVFRIASNLALDHFRKATREAALLSHNPPPLETPSDVPRADDAAEAKQRLAMLEAAMAELPAKCRQALLLNRIEGMKHGEIAKTLGVSESMVAKYLSRALRHCRDRLRHA